MADRVLRDAINLLRKDASVNRPGLYRGQIEDIDDPDRLGRVKVRIWAVHGDTHRTPTTALSWAEIAEPGGGGYDYGSFNPPPVGSAVWIGFEGGHEDFPVVIGTFRGVPKRNEENQNIFLTKDNLPGEERAWKPPDDESETPKDIFDGTGDGGPHPTRRIWQKSYKGHTFLVEDGDGKEFLKIIDRSGQVFEMYCPVAVEHGESNKAQRGVRDATRGDQLGYAAMRDKRALIRIKDLAGQEIILEAREQDEKLIIRSKDRNGSTEQRIVLKSGKGKESIEIVDNAGSHIKFDPNSDDLIAIRDSVGNQINFRKDDGKLVLSGAKQIVTEAPQKLEVIEGHANSAIGGDITEKITGNKNTTVGQDLALGVLGNTSITVGGKIDVVVSNQSLDGTSYTNGIEINLAQILGGNFKVTNVSGNMELSTVLGDWIISTAEGAINISTVVGNASLTTGAGNVEVSTAGGNAMLETLIGEAIVSGGPIVRLGDASATEPFICGALWSTWMSAILNALISHTHQTSTGPSTPPVIGLPALTAALASISNSLSVNVFGQKTKVV